ncbi:MAG: hypothetical protein LBQ09_12135, partial [Acidobacteriaceae bacterium]|nr:hypothetical protein [Acidobacteriaceae bacterium]
MKSQPVLAAAFLVFAATGVYAWASTYHNAPMAGPAGTAAALTTSASLAQGTIELVTPPRDFYGPQPHTFEWTGVKDADAYAMGIWD